MNSSEKVINLTNILKNESSISLNDYEKYKLSEQYNTLFSNSKLENEKNIEEKINNRFYNLSLKQILQNLSKTLIKIINELSIFFEKKNKDYQELIIIFTKEDRMIYVGILFIILSLSIYFIQISS